MPRSGGSRQGGSGQAPASRLAVAPASRLAGPRLWAYVPLQLEVLATLGWHVEQEAPGTPSRLRALTPPDLLYQLPLLQRLQRRLMDCVPRGQAALDPVVLVRMF